MESSELGQYAEELGQYADGFATWLGYPRAPRGPYRRPRKPAPLDPPGKPVTHAAARSTSRTSLNSQNHQLPGTFQNRVQITLAMKLQSAGVGRRPVALMPGHESPASTRPYLHAGLEFKQKALDRTAPPHTRTGRCTPPDKLLAFLESL